METSSDSLVWEREARYEYYRHGPLARMVIGEQLIQGLDYAYTLQGWLKGVNSTGATSLHDMGGDGRTIGADTMNRYTARDAFSYTLNYFDGEFKPINTGVNPFPSNSVVFGATDYRPLYNGNISSMAANVRQFSDPNINGGPMLLYNYKYDQLNRLKAMDAYNSFNSSTNSWSASSRLAAFAEQVTYDGNGNILKYFRNGAADGSYPGYQATIDSLNYKYYANTNRLQRVTDSVPANKMGTNPWEFNYDIDNQSNTSNYKYDSIGNLISDASENIDTIKWSVYGKILEIKKTDPVANHVTNILYKYDAMGNRIGKVVSRYGTSTREFTWYVRDAQGNIMATYTSTGTASDANLQQMPLGTNERYIYGSSRLGMDRWYITTDSTQLYDMRWYNSNIFHRGWKNYELSNHLGNVLATISDKKKGVPLANSSLIDYYEADVQTAQDYYPFGMLMPHRSYASTANYRFGFNGKENDNEPKGLGNQQDYGMRIFDQRLGRFLSVDPLTKVYSMLTPYQYAGNNPVAGKDLDGREFEWFLIEQAERNLFGTSHFKNVRDGFIERGVQTWNEVVHFVQSQKDNPLKWPTYGGGTTTLFAGIPPGVQPADQTGAQVAAQATTAIIKDYVDLFKKASLGDEKAMGALGFEALFFIIPGGEEAKAISKVPRGFKSLEQFMQAGEELAVALEKSGIKFEKIGVRGSSVTGKSFRTGEPFRWGGANPSDIDAFVILSEDIPVKGSTKSPEFIHPDKMLKKYPALREWSEKWGNILQREITPAGFVPKRLKAKPLPKK